MVSPNNTSTKRTTSQRVRPIDLELLRRMRRGQDYCVCELTESLQVTATAVRQRIDRLMSVGMIERTKRVQGQRVQGRGRPTYHYQITDAGLRTCGADPAELTEAMWQAVMDIEDSEVRESVLQRAAVSLGKRYAAESNHDAHSSINTKWSLISKTMQAHQIQAQVVQNGSLPVLDIAACPYPSLSQHDQDRSMCRLEERMLTEALGQPVHLSSCRMDGDACCQFSTLS